MKSRPTEEGQRHRRDCWTAFRAPCPRWWRRSRSPRAPRERGFDWENIEQVFDKLRRRIGRAGRGSRSEAPARRDSKTRSGDLLFVIVNLARFLKVDPEQALRRTNAKFRRRFAHVEAGLSRRRARPLREATIEEMEALWQDAKRQKWMIEVRPLTQLAEFADAVRPAEDHLGIRRHRTAAGAPVCHGEQDRRPSLRRFRRRSHGRLLPGHSGHQAGRKDLPAQPHARRAGGISRSRASAAC